MKATRKLIPALAMLLIAATVATSASYAWFTMNASVTATGMKVTATTSGSLLISKFNNSWTAASTNIDYAPDFTSGGTPGNSIVVIPTSVNPGASADTWYTANGTNANDGKATTEYTALTSLTGSPAWTSNSKVYALHETFYVQSPSGAMTNLGLSKVTYSKSNSQNTNLDIDKAICVRIEIRTVGAPTPSVVTTWSNSGLTTVNYVTGTTLSDITEGYVLTGNNIALKKNAADTVTHTLASVAAATSYQIDTYIYLDGENEECTAYNAYNWAGVSVNLEFSAGVTYDDVESATQS